LSAVKSAEFYQAMLPDANTARGTAVGFQAWMLEVAQREKELETLHGLADEVESQRFKLIGGGILQEFMIYNLIRELTPQGFERGYWSSGALGDLAALDYHLEQLNRELPGYLDTADKNAKAFDRAFPGLLRAYEQRAARLQENLVNLQNALYQMESCAATYDKKVSQAQWHGERSASTGEYYYSSAIGGLAKNLSFVFNAARFENELSEALAEDSLGRADEVMKRYRELAAAYRDLDDKYTAAWNHYYHYQTEVQGDLGFWLNDMTSAAQVPGALLRVTAPDSAGIEKLKSATLPFASVWNSLTKLPAVEVDEKKSKPFQIYSLRKIIQDEGQAWLSLDKTAFLDKYNAIAARINEFKQDTRYTAQAQRLLTDLNAAYTAYVAAHPELAGDPPLPSEPTPAPTPVPAHVELFDVRLNGRALFGDSGEVTVLKSDLRNGAMEITAQLTSSGAVSKLLVSEDGGSWHEMAFTSPFRYRLTPLPGQTYNPAARVKTAAGQEFDLRFFPSISGITYRAIDYQTLAAQTLKSIAEAYERQDIGLFSRYVSDYFTIGRATLEEGVRFDFDLFCQARLVIYIDRMDRRSDAVAVETHWEKTQVARSTGRQQKSTGRTVFTLALENGLMKIKHLRGSLIYASLSPEIAQVSGLSAGIVDQITDARNSRNPIQPGAETYYDPSQLGLQVLSPNGGETWTVGEPRTIAWTVAGAISEVKLDYSSDGGASFSHPIADHAPAVFGSYSWIVPNAPGTAVRVRISDAANSAVSDVSNGNFTIAAAGSTIEEGTVTLAQFLSHPDAEAPIEPMLESYKYSTRQVIQEIDPFLSPTGDFWRREGYMEVKAGNAIQDLGAVSIDSVAAAPTTGYPVETSFYTTSVAGHTYAIKLAEGNYALVQILTLGDYPMPMTATFRYKYQKNGTCNFQ